MSAVIRNRYRYRKISNAPLENKSRLPVEVRLLNAFATIRDGRLRIAIMR